MQYKLYPERLRDAVSCFDGLNSPIGLFVQLPIMIVFYPVLPIIAGIHWHKRSIKEFKVEYSASIKD